MALPHDVDLNGLREGAKCPLGGPQGFRRITTLDLRHKLIRTLLRFLGLDYARRLAINRARAFGLWLVLEQGRLERTGWEPAIRPLHCAWGCMCVEAYFHPFPNAGCDAKASECPTVFSV